MFQLFDRYEMDAGAQVRTTRDGYLVAMPRVARTGVQLYRGSEVGRPDKPVVRVFRPEDQVFNSDSMATFAFKPFTDDHPPVPVTSDNWKDYGKGQLGGEVARDGKFLRVPLVMMDAGTIKKYQDGKCELSVGYSCNLKFGDGISPDGEAYDAIQTDITANHLALVKAARGGKDLKIGDGTGDARVDITVYADALTAVLTGKVDRSSAIGQDNTASLADGYPVSKAGTVYVSGLRAAKTNAIAKGDGDILAAVDSMLSIIGDDTAPSKTTKDTKPMKSMIVDGVTCEMSDTAVEVVTKALDAFNFEKKKSAEELAAEKAKAAKAKDEADASIATLTTKLAAADAKAVTLETQLAADKLTPAKIDALVADRKVVSDKAKVILPTVVVDGKTDHEIRSQVVLAKVGDAAKGWDENMTKISFDTLTAAIPAAQAGAPIVGQRPGGYQDMATAFSTAPAASVLDASNARYDARDKKLQDAWKGEAGKA